MPRLVALLPALLLSGCAELPERENGSDPYDLITAKALQAHVHFLADDSLEGRMTGTPGYNIAANYVATRFHPMGLQPGNGDSWFQQVSYAAATLDQETVRAVLVTPNGERPLVYRDEYLTGPDKVRPAVSLDAPVVFAGHGVHAPALGHDDFDGLDVRGKVVAMFSGAPPSFGSNERAYHSDGQVKRAELVARGAVGTISLRSRESFERYAWADMARNAGTQPSMAWVGSDGQVSNHHPELLGGIALSEHSAQLLFTGADMTYRELVELQANNAPLPRLDLPVRLRLHRDSTQSHTEAPNVLGLLRGNDPALAEQVVVFTAHLDHIGRGAPVNGDAIYNGAYDNAMGIALMIETARVLQAVGTRRSVLFVALSGEEQGMLGSDFLAHYPPVPIERVVANVNLDMPIFTYPPADVVAFGAEHSSLQATVEAAVAMEGLFLSPDPIPEETIFVRSDQYPLVRKGVPAIYLIPGLSSADPMLDGNALFFDFLTSHYHQPSDELPGLPVHWDAAVRFGRANARIGLAAANADEAPTWHPDSFFGQRFGR